MRWLRTKRRFDWGRVGRFHDRHSIGRYQASLDGGLRLAAALEQTAFHQQPIGAHA